MLIGRNQLRLTNWQICKKIQLSSLLFNDICVFTMRFMVQSHLIYHMILKQIRYVCYVVFILFLFKIKYNKQDNIK